MDFQSAKITAAGIPAPGEQGAYTPTMFLKDFPQFRKAGEDDEPILPEHMLTMFVEYANNSVLPSAWGSSWRYAAGLYVAHHAAMYLKTYSDGSAAPEMVAAKSQPTGAVKSATMGDTSIDYDNSAVTIGMEKWGAWNATQYGQQLISQARIVGMGGIYVI